MDPTEKVIVRLSPDTIALLQSLVDRGEYGSLSESVSAAVDQLIKSKLTTKEISKILSEVVREKPVDMESLLTDGDPISMDEAVRKAVSDYIKTRMDPEE